jgi:hypothetical protein
MHEPHAPGGIAYRNRILKRLLEHYLIGRARSTDEVDELTVLTVARFHRLYRYVVAEGYGE